MLVRRLCAMLLSLVAAAAVACAPTGPTPVGRAPVGVAPVGSAPVATGPQTTASRSPAEQRAGDRAFPQIVQQFGGEYRDARLQAYVDDIGRRLVAVSEQPAARWKFTVLDSPEINAFAAPGGYIFVTRGLLGLAEDEAEVASVIGHEIGHVTAGHNQSRQERTAAASLGLLLGQIGLSVLGVDPNLAGVVSQVGQAAAGGYVARYSRQDEFQADELGTRYMARAGFDPAAAADFLRSLAAFSALRAHIKGEEYDPNRVSFLASHPATAERVARAKQLGRSQGGGNGERGAARHLAAIDGLVWGDSAAQGFVRGNRFAHPVLRFTFTVPAGYTITNSAAAVVAEGPNGSRFILDGGRDTGGQLTSYVQSQWAPAIARSARVGPLQRLEPYRINGLDAARALLPVQINRGTYEALLVAIRYNGQIYRFTGIAPARSNQLPAMMNAAETFRALSASEAGALQPTRIDVVTVRAGDTVQSLGSRMNVEARPVDHFMVLNGLTGPGSALRPGQQVKLVR